jgi:hypothetical protein
MAGGQAGWRAGGRTGARELLVTQLSEKERVDDLKQKHNGSFPSGLRERHSSTRQRRLTDPCRELDDAIERLRRAEDAAPVRDHGRLRAPVDRRWPTAMADGEGPTHDRRRAHV